VHRIDEPGHGHLVDIGESDYHADIIRSSNSSLGRFLDNRREYVAEHVTRTRRRGTTAAMGFGSLFHAMALRQPVDRFAVMPSRRVVDPDRYAPDDPEGDKRANATEKAGKAAMEKFRADLGDRVAVEPADAKLAAVMAQALAAHPEANDLLFATEGLREQAAAWTDLETGRLMRCRWDLLFPERNLVIDLKTFAGKEGEDLLGDPHAFASYCDRYSLHRQAAVYLDAFWSVYQCNATFAFVFVEKHPEPRVSVQRVEVDSIAAQIGRHEYRQAIRELQECERTGDWRVPAELGAVPFMVPEWKQRKFEHEDDVRVDLTGAG
jgi:hypothetical protein